MVLIHDGFQISKNSDHETVLSKVDSNIKYTQVDDSTFIDQFSDYMAKTRKIPLGMRKKNIMEYLPAYLKVMRFGLY